VLRCPGLLVALRGLAALYRVSPQRLTEVLPACETHAREDPLGRLGTLAGIVSDVLGAPPVTPTSVHYFHAAWLRDPERVLVHGLRPSPCTRGSLVCDVLLRPGLYGADDQLRFPAFIEDLGPAGRSSLGFELAERLERVTTPCIVEYRRPPARDGDDIEAALWFVAAGLRGTTNPSAAGRHDADGTPIAAHDVVSVRSIATQTEWTPAPAPP